MFARIISLVSPTLNSVLPQISQLRNSVGITEAGWSSPPSNLNSVHDPHPRLELGLGWGGVVWGVGQVH
jgi:hypothetical protein